MATAPLRQLEDANRHADTVPTTIAAGVPASARAAIGGPAAGNAAVVQRRGAPRVKEDSEQLASMGGDAFKGASAASAVTKVSAGIADHTGASGAAATGAIGGSGLNLLGSVSQVGQGFGNLARSYEKTSGKDVSASAAAESRVLDKEAASNLAPGAMGTVAGGVGVAAAVAGQSAGSGSLGKGFAGLSAVAGLFTAIAGLTQMVAAIKRTRALSAADPRQQLAAERAHHAELTKALTDKRGLLEQSAAAQAALPDARARRDAVLAEPDDDGRKLRLAHAEQAVMQLEAGVADAAAAAKAIDALYAQLFRSKQRIEALTKIVDDPVADSVPAPYEAPKLSLGAAQQQLRKAAIRKAVSSAGSAVGGLVQSAAGATALAQGGTSGSEKVGFGVGAAVGGAASLGSFGWKKAFGPGDAERLGAAQSLMMAAARPVAPVPEPVAGERSADDLSPVPKEPGAPVADGAVFATAEQEAADGIISAITADPATVRTDSRSGKAKDAVEYLLTVAGRA